MEHLSHNARICGWFGAQRKTSPTTCVCYALLEQIILKNSEAT